MLECNCEENSTKIDPAILQALSNGLTGFEFSPTGAISFTNTKPTTLQAEIKYDRSFLENTSAAAAADEFIRYDLAHKIATMMLDEDLILVEQNTDINTDIVTYRARIKLIQE